MLEGYTVRPLLPQDFSRGFFTSLSALSPSPKIENGRADNIAFERENSGHFTFVAVENATDAVIGTASFYLESKFSRGGYTLAHIEDVAVDPDYQKMGIGSLLIREILSVCKEKGCRSVVLHCSTERISFYEQFGFFQNAVAMRIDL